MALSLNHILLVEKLIDYIKSDLFPEILLFVKADIPSLKKYNCPPAIGKSIPDVYATSIDNSLMIIGEAKTKDDVETKHSLSQYLDYLRFCNENAGSIIVFAVPWTRIATIKNRIRMIKKEENIDNVQIYYVPLLPE